MGLLFWLFIIRIFHVTLICKILRSFCLIWYFSYRIKFCDSSHCGSSWIGSIGFSHWNFYGLYTLCILLVYVIYGDSILLDSKTSYQYFLNVKSRKTHQYRNERILIKKLIMKKC